MKEKVLNTLKYLTDFNTKEVATILVVLFIAYALSGVSLFG